MDKLFKDVERSLKTLAKVNLVCGIILAVVLLMWGVITGVGALTVAGIVAGCMFFMLSVISSWFIYAFAELVESTKETNRVLKLGYAEDITKEQEKKEEYERVSAAQAEWERQQREAEREAEEAAKLARIVAYWDSHPEEKKALVNKRAAAEQKLKEAKLTSDQRKALEDLIKAIDEEFEKDREG